MYDEASVTHVRTQSRLFARHSWQDAASDTFTLRAKPWLGRGGRAPARGGGGARPPGELFQATASAEKGPPRPPWGLSQEEFPVLARIGLAKSSLRLRNRDRSIDADSTSSIHGLDLASPV